ncbi:MAG: RNA polymerase sigma-70 factor [Rikenellaceae bacterium]
MNSKNVDIESLFRMYYRPLSLYALHFVGDIDSAEDVVQDSFADMWSLVDSGKEIVNIKAYLFAVVKNRALARVKQDRLRRGVDLPLSDPSIDYEALTEDSMIEARIWTAIDSLPDRCREIFLMSKRDGMKYAEIAQELGISPKTVENQISKALRTLKEGAVKIYNFFFA